MTVFFVQFAIIVSTSLLFLVINRVNEWMIGELHFIPGMNWFSLSAGICVLATLLLGATGAFAILVGYFLLYFLSFKFVDLPQAILGSVAHSVGPYLVYLSVDRAYGLRASLIDLTSNRLLLVIVVCSAICPALQSIGMNISGNTGDLLIHCLQMFAGNLAGALILTYMLKAISAVLP